MIKEMKGWKVITIWSRSSARARISACVEYLVQREAKPKIPGSKLFFFKERADADKFCGDNEQIVPCIAKNVTKPKYMIDNIFCIDHFWQWKNKHPNRSIKEYRPLRPKQTYFPIVTTAPKGTYWAESIICLK